MNAQADIAQRADGEEGVAIDEQLKYLGIVRRAHAVVDASNAEFLNGRPNPAGRAFFPAVHRKVLHAEIAGALVNLLVLLGLYVTTSISVNVER